MDEPVDPSKRLESMITPAMIERFHDDMVRRGLCIKFPKPVALDSPEAAAASDLLARKN